MTAGLPGAGIGGLFYLAGALLMPVRELAAWVRGSREPRIRLAAGQFAMALAVIVSIHMTGRLLGALIAAAATGETASGAATTAAVPSALRTATVLLSLGTLVGVLVAVQVARLVFRSEPAEPVMPADARPAGRGQRRGRSGPVRAHSGSAPRLPTPEPRRNASE